MEKLTLALCTFWAMWMVWNDDSPFFGTGWYIKPIAWLWLILCLLSWALMVATAIRNSRKTDTPKGI